jgi:hypothetical protein
VNTIDIVDSTHGGMKNKGIITYVCFEVHCLVARQLFTTVIFLETHQYRKINYVGFKAVAALQLRSELFSGVAPPQWAIGARRFGATWLSDCQRLNCTMNKFPVKYTHPALC